MSFRALFQAQTDILEELSRSCVVSHAFEYLYQNVVRYIQESAVK
jgi:hypothetical protein